MEDTDPLTRSDKEDEEDLFKSLNGSAGVIKITTDNDSQPEKCDMIKPVVDCTSPEEDDLFSDCRSEVSRVSQDLGRSPTLPLGEISGDLLAVTVSEPHKVGEGMTSYMAYRVLTKTNLHTFRRQTFSVVRRFSDFLSLHEKLVARYQGKGRIIPPAPEKSIIGTTRVKMGTSGEAAGAGQVAGEAGGRCKANFIARRRAALERFINRVALHPVLRLDADFLDFLESEGELPRASSAISSASVLKMITRVGDTVNKIAYKMEEGDDWFEEKTQHVEQMESQLKKLYIVVENVVTYRRELAVTTGQFAHSVSCLANSEEAFHLSRALEGLARTEEKVELSLQDQADADYANILELTRDYLALVAAVKEVLGERVKTFMAWQNAVNTLHKKREQRSRMELGGRLDKMGTAIEDVTEWENKVEEYQDAFQKISQVIKVEMELFQHYRVTDFKNIIVMYLEDLTKTQLDMINHWEGLLDETKRVM